MATNTFHVVIAHVDDTLFDGAAESVTVPGSAGVMTLLPHHEPITTTLKKGSITVKSGSETKTFSVDGGVLECSQGRAVVLL